MRISVSCVTVSFILEANKATCSSYQLLRLFIGEVFDFPKTRLQCFEIVFITLMYAAALYTLLDALTNICNCIICISNDLKLTKFVQLVMTTSK